MNQRRLRFHSILLSLLLVCSLAFSACSDTSAELPDQVLQAGFGLSGESSNLEVHFIDVGQADCVLIRTDEHAMLVDAGNNADAQLIIDYLDDLGIEALDYVIGTHPHEDHIGSLDSVIDTFEIGEVILPEKIHTSATFEDVLDSIEAKGLSITPAVPGEEYELGEASFLIFAPNADYGDNLNNWSVGIRLTYGSTSFVMSGDAEASAEEDILEAGYDLSADVFKASHHGSETSNTREYLEAINPSAAVISCGVDNSYGHPDASVLELFEELGIDVYRTDEQGTIIAISDGSNITFSTAPDAEGANASNNTDANASDNAEADDSGEATGTANGDSADDIIVHITQTGERYHTAGCSSLSDSDTEVTLEEARALGLTPCGRCNPPE